MSKYFSEEYQEQLIGALRACKHSMNSEGFKVHDLRKFFTIPANFGRALQELKIASYAGRSWSWTATSDDFRAMAGHIAKRCLELDKAQQARALESQKTESTPAPSLGEQQELYPKEEGLTELLERLARAQKEMADITASVARLSAVGA